MFFLFVLYVLFMLLDIIFFKKNDIFVDVGARTTKRFVDCYITVRGVVSH